ncbi:PREDICTED: protein SMAX1-LIKE 4 [Theobroma cacao]|uniref:Protein SMAX1-LIKE 4 n=1 Tax=Theobroma cacao TaxID=3641 RepID=A0AB32WWB4_THECC|nr:PREDICTED: protein SMAX1-LIKE 4 [Theobroma cacao]
MRSGACAVQQTLTTEAASVLKHSLSLARRRGHAQVTPLHVAATLLSSRASLLRRACLKSQPHPTPHPLQCRALELCFNVALNRLPTTPGPLLHGQPSLSNALIAALKRAQAHQRRGCVEQQQQQPLLTVKVELEQLVISILDDPSVSRVMREAGFSSTAVRNNIEDSSASSVFQCYSTSGGVFSSPCSPSPTDSQRELVNPSTFWQTHLLTYSSEQNPFFFSPQKKVPSNYVTDSASVKEDIKLVFEVFLRKKRKNTVIVGDCVSTTEGLVSELTERIERGDVPEEMKHVHFVKFYFAPVSLRFMKREDVEKHLADLRRKVDCVASGGEGAIIYAGDLTWTAEENLNGEIPGYRAVDHLVTEIGRLLSDYNFSNTKVWLVATASYQTYLRCHMRQPPLEAQWALQAVSVPSEGLGLSLHASSVHDSRMPFAQNPSQVLESKPFANKEEHDKLSCCAECTTNYEKDVQLFKSGQQKLLPPWLQPHGSNNAYQKDELLELRRKWNRLCHSLHQGRHNQNHLRSTLYNNQSHTGKSHPYASSYPWWPCQSSMFPDSTSIYFSDSGSKLNHSPNSVPKFRRQNSCTIEFNFGNGTHKHESGEPNLDSLKNSEDKEVKITLALGNSLFSNSGKPAKETSEVCKLLQANVPWQSETIPSIAETLIDSKSTKKETWLLIQGNDVIGKRRLARAIAESVLGSPDFLLHMNMRNNEVTSCSETLVRALRNNDRLVVLVENVDLADTQFLKLLADGFEAGLFGESREREGGSNQAIFILTKSISSSYEDGKRNQDSVLEMKLNVNEKSSSFGSPNSENKRKAEWDVSNKIKTPRIDEEDPSSTGGENGSIKKELSRQSSLNTLDLNMKADEDDESGDKPGEFSPISSDLTRETTADPHIPIGFLKLIQNRYVFNQNATQEKEMKEFFVSKMKGSLKETFGGQNVISFSVEKRVLEGILFGSSYFLNSLFEKWLKDIFQTGLQTVKIGGKEGIGEIRLSYGGIGEKAMENGYMGTCLPKKIQVSFMG